MIIEYNNLKLKVYWQHQTEKYERNSNFLKQRWTKCFVEMLETKHLVIVGESWLNPADVFSKKVGRRLSFFRAMNGIILSDNPKLIPTLLSKKLVSEDVWNEHLEKEKEKVKAVGALRKPLMLQYITQMPKDFMS